MTRQSCVCSCWVPACCRIVATAPTLRATRSSSQWTSHRHLTRSLDLIVAGQWLGRAVRRTSHQWATLNFASWFWRGSNCFYCWGSSNLAFLSDQVYVWRVVVGCIATSVAARLNICCKPVRRWPYVWTSAVSRYVGGRTFVHLL